MRCPSCDHSNDDDATTCTECGATLSDPDATMDSMIQQASVPNLASLFRQAKKSGAIKPAFQYAQT